MTNAKAAVKAILPALLLSLRLAAPAATIAADPWQRLDPDPKKMLGTLSCASATCHGRTEPLHTASTVECQESLHFLAGDPHAQAAQRMSEPRFQDVLARLKPEAPAKESAERCASCHDPLGLASQATGLPLGRGIGCESCHGPARDWLALHYEQGVSRERLSQLGLLDTKQVLVRGRVCASCHVGDEGRDVNHDLLAAGHPPLRFELASHQALIERKHWNDIPRRAQEPNYEIQLWAAGRIASAEAALTLLESRARQDNPIAPWPEFAESDCRACHQPLRSDSPGSRGALPWQRWNMALNLPLRELDALRAEMERSLVPSRETALRLAADAKSALRRQLRLSPSGQLLGSKAVPLDARDVLQLLSNESPTNWETACQHLAALAAAQQAGDVNRLRELAALLRQTDPSLTQVAEGLAAARREMSENRKP